MNQKNPTDQIVSHLALVVEFMVQHHRFKNMMSLTLLKSRLELLLISISVLVTVTAANTSLFLDINHVIVHYANCYTNIFIPEAFAKELTQTKTPIAISTIP